MADRWIDVSGYQRPEQMLWHEWAIPRGQYRLTLGRTIDPTGPLHRANMRAAGMATGSYAVPVEYAPIADQAWAWVDNTPDDDENDDWVDAERAQLTEPMLRAYCEAYELRSRRGRLAIYTGWPWWMSHVPAGARSAYVAYPLIVAGYPFDSPADKVPPMDGLSVARRSTPPVAHRPAVPPPWVVEAGWQHSGQGSMPGYGKFLDMGIYRVNPGGAPSPTDPLFTATQLQAIADAARIVRTAADKLAEMAGQ
jgi:hypothetical protein